MEPTFHETAEPALQAMLARISAMSKGDSTRSIYIHSSGQPKSLFREIKSQSEDVLLWTCSSFPVGLRFLSVMLAAHEGLVRVRDGSRLASLFEKLSESSMATVYFLRTDLESILIKKVKESSVTAPQEIIKADSGAIVYDVDTNHVGSSTGMYSCLHAGPDSPLAVVETTV